MAASDDIDVKSLIDEGYDYEDIVDELKDAGYDAEDIAEAFADLGYDWEDALIDAIHDQLIDLDDAAYYADLLGVSEHDVYDMYYDYDES